MKHAHGKSAGNFGKNQIMPHFNFYKGQENLMLEGSALDDLC